MARLDVLEKLVSKEPNDPFPYYCLAQEYRSLGRVDDALGAFARLKLRFSGYVPQYLMAAQLCHEHGRADEARQWASEGVAAARAARDSHAAGELESFLAGLGA